MGAATARSAAGRVDGTAGTSRSPPAVAVSNGARTGAPPACRGSCWPAPWWGGRGPPAEARPQGRADRVGVGPRAHVPAEVLLDGRKPEGEGVRAERAVADPGEQRP